jgi:hypothetical protein
MNINVKTKIRYKGREYASPAELPADARAAYEQAIAGAPAAGPNQTVSKKIILNGQEFSNLDQMPAGDRKLYEDAMHLMRDTRATKQTN